MTSNEKFFTGVAISAAIYFIFEEKTSADTVKQKTKGAITAGAALSYIKKYFPMAQETEKFYQVPAFVTIAQGGLESGWETSDIVRNSNNHFGIKADSSWHGPTYKGYRAYPDAASSFNDHAKFLVKMPRYANAFRTNDPIEFARQMAAAKYSESPTYAEVLTGVIKNVAAIINHPAKSL